AHSVNSTQRQGSGGGDSSTGTCVVALRAHSRRMQEDCLVLAQMIESRGDDVACTDQPRRRASDEATLLMSTRFQPAVEQCEVRAAVIDFVVAMTDQLPAAHLGHVLRHL